MGYIIEITEDKAMDLKEKAKKILKIGKEMYECIEELAEDSQMGERGGYGRYGMRDDDMRPEDDDRMGERYPRERWEDWPPYMSERRGRSASTGRYVRR